MASACGVSVAVLLIAGAVAAAPFQGGGFEAGQGSEEYGPGQLDLLRYLEDRRGFTDNRLSEHPSRRFSGFGDTGRLLSARRASLGSKMGADESEKFVKRNIDEIDRTAFDSFFKRNFDEIDRVGWSGFVKRFGNDLDRQRY